MVPSETKGFEPKHEQETGALCSAMELCQVSFLFAFVFVCLCVLFIFHVFIAACIVSGTIILTPCKKEKCDGGKESCGIPVAKPNDHYPTELRRCGSASVLKQQRWSTAALSAKSLATMRLRIVTRAIIVEGRSEIVMKCRSL